MRLSVICVVTAFMTTLGCNHNQEGGHGASGSPAAANNRVVTQRSAMKEIAMMVPIAPGKTDAWVQKHQELMGSGYDEYAASRQRFGITRQVSFLQRTPMGDFEVVYMSSPDIDKSFRTMSESSAAFDVDWRKLTKDFHGVDFSTGVSAFPEVELVFEMGKGELSGAKPFLFAAPIGREGGAKLRDTAKALMGARNAEYLRARERIGVKREAVFLQSTPVGQVLVFYWLAADPTASLKQQMDSIDPFDQWLRAQIGQVHPMPSDILFATVSQNRIAVEYPRSE